MLRSYLSPSLCSCAVRLVIILLRIPVGIIATIPVTLLAIALLGIILSIAGLLAITTCNKHSSLLIHNSNTIHEICTKGKSWGNKNYQMIQQTAWFQPSTAMWTRSALFWFNTLFITIKCHILPCLASLIGTVTGMQKTINYESTDHVSWCYCKTIRKTMQVLTNTQDCPHIQFVVTAKNRSILSQHRGGITPVKYNNGKPKGVLSLLTKETSFQQQHCTCTFLVNVPISSYWCSPQYEPLTH